MKTALLETAYYRQNAAYTKTGHADNLSLRTQRGDLASPQRPAVLTPEPFYGSTKFAPATAMMR